MSCLLTIVAISVIFVIRVIIIRFIVAVGFVVALFIHFESIVLPDPFPCLVAGISASTLILKCGSSIGPGHICPPSLSPQNLVLSANGSCHGLDGSRLPPSLLPSNPTLLGRTLQFEIDIIVTSWSLLFLWERLSNPAVVRKFRLSRSALRLNWGRCTCVAPQTNASFLVRPSSRRSS